MLRASPAVRHVPIAFALVIAAVFIAFLFTGPQQAASQSSPTVIFLTSGTSWTVPSDWNNSNNTIEVIGGGGGGGVNAIRPNGGDGGAGAAGSEWDSTHGTGRGGGGTKGGTLAGNGAAGGSYGGGGGNGASSGKAGGTGGPGIIVIMYASIATVPLAPTSLSATAGATSTLDILKSWEFI